VELTAKENALEDCMAAIKKAYEKEQLNLIDFLSTIRKLSNKQFKTTLKRNKIVNALSKGANQ
jgi:Vps23 core domain